SMSRSVIGSVAGHIQVYSSKSKDPLEVLPGMAFGEPNLKQLDDFSKIKKTLMTVPNVKAVIPMGISGALVTSGNTIDITLAKLREAVRRQLGNPGDKAAEAQVATERGHVRQIISVLQTDLKNMKALVEEKAINKDEVEAVGRAASDEFWASFDRDPLNALEFLENRIAPQATDADLLFLRYVGTDPAAFARSFDRMRIVEGKAIPQGERGFLFSKLVYEDQLKLKTAKRLDKIKEARDIKKALIATDLDLQRYVRENQSQVREILLQLDAPKTKLFRQRLQQHLGSQETDVATLLAALFKTTDDNFDARYAFFYQQLAPELELYRIRIGDNLTIKAFTRSGYVQSVNLKVFGTFEFEGLEKSGLAGALNMMDLVSFRELYGFLTSDKLAEMKEMQSAVSAKSVSRENAEAELFGTRTVEATATPGIAAAAPVAGREDNPDLGGLAASLKKRDLVKRVYPEQELESGVVLNAAVILEHYTPRTMAAAMTAIEAAGKRDGLDLKAISWREAAGLIGKFVDLMKAVLYIAVLIIFLVALVIINNAMVMATLERVQEIGTLRAVGAQRRFILGMLLIESLVIGLIFGALGAGAGALLVRLIARVGIPANNDIVAFFFSGPRLYPFLSSTNLAVAFIIVMLVSGLSSFYPAWLAMRVTPRQAMQSEE
ncbi:MAG TPA: FtsX-like permease family protein, partial [Polyangia bacterium]|nr:FtsX-like permease family protein [Polyangia bacterium]